LATVETCKVATVPGCTQAGETDAVIGSSAAVACQSYDADGVGFAAPGEATAALDAAAEPAGADGRLDAGALAEVDGAPDWLAAGT
jgi:hypothetical protein